MESSIRQNTVGDVMKKRNVELHHSSTVTSANLKQSTGKPKIKRRKLSRVIPCRRLCEIRINRRDIVLIFIRPPTATIFAVIKRFDMRNIRARVSRLQQSERVDRRLLRPSINLHHIPKLRLLLSRLPHPPAS